MATYGDPTSLPPKALSVKPVEAAMFKAEGWARQNPFRAF